LRFRQGGNIIKHDLDACTGDPVHPCRPRRGQRWQTREILEIALLVTPGIKAPGRSIGDTKIA
jgi:hypothetical protein